MKSKLGSATIFALAALFGFSVFAGGVVAFENNDSVAVVGNALADRMQHDGWLEAVVQRETKGLNLSWRDMGFSGDRVAVRPRSKGSYSAEWYLEHVKADVIFAMFGYNESFAGKDLSLIHI